MMFFPFLLVRPVLSSLSVFPLRTVGDASHIHVPKLGSSRYSILPPFHLSYHNCDPHISNIRGHNRDLQHTMGLPWRHARPRSLQSAAAVIGKFSSVDIVAYLPSSHLAEHVIGGITYRWRFKCTSKNKVSVPCRAEEREFDEELTPDLPNLSRPQRCINQAARGRNQRAPEVPL